MPSIIIPPSNYDPIRTISYAGRYPVAFGLLHTSRQIRYVVLPILYKYTVLDVSRSFISWEVLNIPTRNAIKSIVFDEIWSTVLGCDGILTGGTQHRHVGKNWRLSTGLSGAFPALEHIHAEVDDPKVWQQDVGRRQECVVATQRGKKVCIHVKKLGQRENMI